MLEACNLAFAYPGSAEAVFDGFSASFDAGERVALVAPSGFGKTTLCRLLAGFEEPTAGEVLCDGQPLPSRGACPVQLVSQHPEQAIDPRMRLADTLAEAGDVDEGLLRALEIRDEWFGRFPHELSGGELQRFCIARAVAAHPRYLIADEISTMLDAVSQARIWSFLLEVARREGLGLVFVSHSPALVARLATRTFDLSDACHWNRSQLAHSPVMKRGREECAN